LTRGRRRPIALSNLNEARRCSGDHQLFVVAVGAKRVEATFSVIEFRQQIK
jgi:hypothetical protein